MSRKKKQDFPETFFEDLLNKAQNYQELGKDCFRQKELNRLFDLTVEHGRNVIIIGNPGVGKNYLIEALARKIADKNSSHSVEKIVRLKSFSLVAGTGVRGTLEENFKTLIEKITPSSYFNKTIVVIPNLHFWTKIGATADNPHGNLLNILLLDYSDYLKKDNIAFVGITTPEGFHQLTAVYSQIQNYFEILRLEPMSEEDTIKSLENYLKEKKFNNLSIEFYSYVVRMGEQIFPNLSSPGNAITLLFKAFPQLNQNKNITSDEGIRIINQVITELTGLREELFSEDPIEKEKILKNLKEYYKGYEEHLSRMVDFFLRFKAKLTPRDRPAGSVLMVGPTGVGKTELVRQIANYMYKGNLKKLKIYDMTEYATIDDIKRLIGDSFNPLSQGRLIKDISNDPFSIFLFDEIEKAHPAVRNIFLQILGDGRITDAFGNTYSFKNAFIFMTSNIGFEPGSPLYERNEVSKDEVLKKLYEKFPKELLNRIEEIFIFNFLDENTLKEITEKELKNIFCKDRPTARIFCLKKEVKIEWSKEVPEFISSKLIKDSKKFGAREIQRVIEREIIFPLSYIICKNPELTHFEIVIEDGKIIVRKKQDGS